MWYQGTRRLHNAKQNNALWNPVAKFLDTAIHMTRNLGRHGLPNANQQESAEFVTPVDNRTQFDKRQEALRTLDRKRQMRDELNGHALSKPFRDKLEAAYEDLEERISVYGEIAAYGNVSAEQDQMFREQNVLREEKEARIEQVENE